MTRFLGVAAMLVMACNGGGALSLTDFLNQDLKGQCHFQFRCCSSAEIGVLFANETFNGQPITTESQCDQAETGFTALAVGIIQGSIDSGRVSYDGDAAADCVGEISGAACSDGVGGVPNVGTAGACASVFTPKVADGGACSQSLECTTNNCVGAAVGGSDAHDGSCGPLPGTGSACDFDCAPGDFCTFDGSAETCQPKLAAGSACEDKDQCDTGACEGSDVSSMTCVAICQGT